MRSLVDCGVLSWLMYARKRFFSLGTEIVDSQISPRHNSNMSNEVHTVTQTDPTDSEPEDMDETKTEGEEGDDNKPEAPKPRACLEDLSEYVTTQANDVEKTKHAACLEAALRYQETDYGVYSCFVCQKTHCITTTKLYEQTMNENKGWYDARFIDTDPIEIREHTRQRFNQRIYGCTDPPFDLPLCILHMIEVNYPDYDEEQLKGCFKSEEFWK